MGGEERLPLEERAKEEQAGAEGSYQWGEASFDSALLKKELHLSPAAFGPLGIRYGSGKGAPWGSFHPRIGYYVKRFFSYSLDALSSPARSPPAPPPPPPPPPSRLRNRDRIEDPAVSLRSSSALLFALLADWSLVGRSVGGLSAAR